MEVPVVGERRGRFPPKPLTPERELARLRRREKQIVCDQIREKKKIVKKQKEEIECGQAIPSERAIITRIWIRQKWSEVPYIKGTTWAKFRRYLKRKFKLKQFRWGFDESMGESGWCQKLQNPFSVDPAKRYRIVLQEKISRKTRLGKQLPHMTKEQRMRPNSRGAKSAPADPWHWSPPPDENPAPCVTPSPAPGARRKPLPSPGSEAHTSPSVALTPASKVQPEKNRPEQPILPPPSETLTPASQAPPESRKKTAADFVWSPQLVDFQLKVVFCEFGGYGSASQDAGKCITKWYRDAVEQRI
jgi:hypothetical protein